MASMAPFDSVIWLSDTSGGCGKGGEGVAEFEWNKVQAYLVVIWTVRCLYVNYQIVVGVHHIGGWRC